MTKVFQIFEEEKQEALQAEKRNVVKRLLEKKADMDFIMYVTDLTEEEIKKIQEDMLITK